MCAWWGGRGEGERGPPCSSGSTRCIKYLILVCNTHQKSTLFSGTVVTLEPLVTWRSVYGAYKQHDAMERCCLQPKGAAVVSCYGVNCSRRLHLRAINPLPPFHRPRELITLSPLLSRLITIENDFRQS